MRHHDVKWKRSHERRTGYADQSGRHLTHVHLRAVRAGCDHRNGIEQVSFCAVQRRVNHEACGACWPRWGQPRCVHERLNRNRVVAWSIIHDVNPVRRIRNWQHQSRVCPSEHGHHSLEHQRATEPRVEVQSACSTCPHAHADGIEAQACLLCPSPSCGRSNDFAVNRIVAAENGQRGVTVYYPRAVRTFSGWNIRVKELSRNSSWGEPSRRHRRSTMNHPNRLEVACLYISMNNPGFMGMI